MGTSTSHRAPATPRWQGFVAAVTAGESIDRIRSELFNAGNEWQAELASDAIVRFAAAVAESFESLPQRLEQSSRPETVFLAAIQEARDASVDVGFSPALAIAERAYARLLLSTAAPDAVIGSSGTALANAWRAARGDSAEALVGRYAGEVLAQYARHVVDRELGRITTLDRDRRDRLRGLTESLARHAIALGLEATSTSPGSTSDTWRSAIERAFDRGRVLPESAE